MVVTAVITVPALLDATALLDTTKDDEAKEDEESEDPNSEEPDNKVSKKDDEVSEVCRDSRSGVLLEDDEDGVASAGAVVFVTICRLTCLGK